LFKNDTETIFIFIFIFILISIVFYRTADKSNPKKSRQNLTLSVRIMDDWLNFTRHQV